MRGMIKSLKNLIPILVLISTPALAIDPDYVGAWAPSPEACKDGGRTAFRITPKGTYGREWSCEIKQATSDGAGWLVHLSCAVEGTESTPTWRWYLAPNGRLREAQKDRLSEYVRCKDSDYPLTPGRDNPR
jgi:hypothetical protein